MRSTPNLWRVRREGRIRSRGYDRGRHRVTFRMAGIRLINEGRKVISIPAPVRSSSKRL
jgi:hypothetical protein